MARHEQYLYYDFMNHAESDGVVREEVSIAGSVTEFWETGMRQLGAVAKREFRQDGTKIIGARLLSFHGEFARQPREPSSQVTSPVQSPDST